jgi:hypothetical protein
MRREVDRCLSTDSKRRRALKTERFRLSRAANFRTSPASNTFCKTHYLEDVKKRLQIRRGGRCVPFDIGDDLSKRHALWTAGDPRISGFYGTYNYELGRICVNR